MAKNLDYANIGFAYHKTDKRYISYWKEGAWDAGCLSECFIPLNFWRCRDFLRIVS